MAKLDKELKVEVAVLTQTPFFRRLDKNTKYPARHRAEQGMSRNFTFRKDIDE